MLALSPSPAVGGDGKIGGPSTLLVTLGRM